MIGCFALWFHLKRKDSLHEEEDKDDHVTHMHTNSKLKEQQV